MATSWSPYRDGLWAARESFTATLERALSRRRKIPRKLRRHFPAKLVAELNSLEKALRQPLTSLAAIWASEKTLREYEHALDAGLELGEQRRRGRSRLLRARGRRALWVVGFFAPFVAVVGFLLYERYCDHAAQSQTAQCLQTGNCKPNLSALFNSHEPG